MKNFLQNNAYFLIGLILSCALLWPIFAAPYFSHHDDVQVIRLHQMDKCFKDGQIPCRWVPDLGGLYGYPLFNYYAPLPYYFGEIFYLITHNLIISSKIMFAASFIGAYIFMYLAGRKLWGNLGGSMSAIFYSFAPYHAVDFYVRGAMGELWGLMFFPAIIWATLRLYEKFSTFNIVILGLFISFLVISHNLSTMVFIPFLVLFVAVLFLKNKKMNFLWGVLASLLLSVSLSAFYLLPVLFEKNLVHIDTTTSGYFSYTEHFKGLKKVLVDRDWGWGASVREVPGGEKDGLSFQFGWGNSLFILTALFFAIKNRKTNKFGFAVVVFLFLTTLFSIFMINPRSQIIWDAIDPLKYLQFPWRFLMLTIFTASLATGYIIVPLNLKYQRILWVSAAIIICSLNFAYFRPEKFIQTNDQQLLTGDNWDKQIKRSIYDYLPIYAKEPPRDLATQRYQILTGDTSIADFKEGTNWISFKADTRTHSIIRLSQYYFPDWKIFVDGAQVPVEYKDNSLGLMTIILGVGNHNVEARLYDTPVRTMGNFISLIGFGVVIILLLFQSNRFKKSLSYYLKGIR